METLTFEKLPEAVALLLEKVGKIESLLADQPFVAKGSDRMTVHQAAEFLTVAVSTIYNKVSLKEIPVNKQGKRLYFYKSELEEWIRQGRRLTISESRRSGQLSRKGRGQNRQV